MGFSMNGKFASGAVEQDEAKNEDEWLRSILLCYFYSVVNEKQSRLLLCSIPLRPLQSRKTTRVALCLCDEAKRAFLQEYGAQCVWFIVLEWYDTST